MSPLVPLGDRAFLARFDDESTAARWAAAVERERWPGIVDVVLAFRSVAVHADPVGVDLDALAQRLATIEPLDVLDPTGALVTIPVLYDGPDLQDVAQRLALTVDEVIAAHGCGEYRVFALGFRPGFPYAGYLPARLSGLARRPSPRTRVPAGSVAIVGRQTSVYPVDSPGGWHLLGTTPLRIVDVERGIFPIRAGDRIRFAPISPEEFRARRGEQLIR